MSEMLRSMEEPRLEEPRLEELKLEDPSLGALPCSPCSFCRTRGALAASNRTSRAGRGVGAGAGAARGVVMGWKP